MKNTELELIPASRQGALPNIRNFLAGRFIGATRDRSLMEELCKCAFAKHAFRNGRFEKPEIFWRYRLATAFGMFYRGDVGARRMGCGVSVAGGGWGS
jgi:hypothetical protein